MEITKDTKFCQSCAMPLTDPATMGTNKDGSANEEYCIHCYKDGAYTYDCTMEEMIEQSVPFVSQDNPYPNAEAARSAMQELFPKLRRWS